jgi:hypothetical protein
MRHEHRLVALVDNLSEGGIEEERHVVVHHLKARDLPAAAGALDLQIDEPQVRHALRTRCLEVLIGGRRKLREGFGRVGCKILRGHTPEKISDKGGRHGRARFLQHRHHFPGPLARAHRLIDLHRALVSEAQGGQGSHRRAGAATFV